MPTPSLRTLRLTKKPVNETKTTISSSSQLPDIVPPKALCDNWASTVFIQQFYVTYVYLLKLIYNNVKFIKKKHIEQTLTS